MHGSKWQRFVDSAFYHDFRRDKIAITSFVILCI